MRNKTTFGPPGWDPFKPLSATGAYAFKYIPYADSTTISENTSPLRVMTGNDDQQPSEYVVIPDYGGNERYRVVARGSKEHCWAFNFLRDKGKLDMWTERHPGFLPLRGCE